MAFVLKRVLYGVRNVARFRVVHEMEDLVDGLAYRARDLPAGDLLRDRIDAGDDAAGIRRDDAIADALEGDREVGLPVARAPLRFLTLAERTLEPKYHQREEDDAERAARELGGAGELDALRGARFALREKRALGGDHCGETGTHPVHLFRPAQRVDCQLDALVASSALLLRHCFVEELQTAFHAWLEGVEPRDLRRVVGDERAEPREVTGRSCLRVAIRLE